ncbi:SRPBCC family protein [Lysobacter sp. D1-1-M9]|uniref:SRPBCC family protein n=1 Tax=Novilysobacter longmucuonensis TaxID=3098603 RepID=UPI002FCA4847
MTRLIEILISLAIVTALFLIIGVLLPNSRHLSESVETNRKVTIVYDTLNSFRRFDDWHPLVLRDSAVQLERTGPDSGVGARLEYTSLDENLAEGSWEIVANEPNRSISMDITNAERGENKRTKYTLRPTGRSGRNIEITQTYDVDYGWNLLGRYAGMYVSSNMGQDMKLGLSRLSNMLATVPNVDYTELSRDNPDRVPTIGRRPAETLLVVTAAVERNNQVVQRQMRSNLEWIERVIEANDLEATGPVRIITNEFGSENYSFDVAVPVRALGEGDSADEAEDADAEDADADENGESSAPVASGPEPTEAIEIEDGLDSPVESVFMPASEIAVVPFEGHMANLPNVRDALRAWALTQGYETTGRPYEIWENGIDGGFSEDGEYEVVWTIR